MKGQERVGFPAAFRLLLDNGDMRALPPRLLWQRWTLAVVIAATGFYSLGNGRINLWDCDEAWYAQTSRQMLQSGDWVVPHFLQPPRCAKPILVYWFQALAMKCLGATALAARAPSVLAVSLTAAGLALALQRAIGPRRTMYAVIVFATSMMVIFGAKLANPDGLLLLSMTAAQGALFAMYKGALRLRSARERAHGAHVFSLAPATLGHDAWTPMIVFEKTRQPATELASGAHAAAIGRLGWSRAVESSGRASAASLVVPIIFWVCVALAGLTKGPFVLAVMLSTMLTLAALEVGVRWRSVSAWREAMSWWPSLRPLIGAGIVACIVLPWLILAWQRDRQFVINLLAEPSRHLLSNQSGGHPSFPGYHLLTVWIVFLPWSLLLPWGIAYGWRHRRRPIVRFALAMALGNWLFVEIMTTKLPQYLLPAYPALALLVACALTELTRRERRQRSPWLIVAALLWGAAIALFSTMPWLPGRYFPIPKVEAAAFTAAAILYAVAVVGCIVRRRLATAGAVVIPIGLMLVLSVLLLEYLPAARFVRVPLTAANEINSLRGSDRTPVDVVGIRMFDPADYDMPGYPAPSLAFYLNGEVRERGDDFLSREPPDRWPAMMMVTGDVLERLPPARRSALREIDRFRAANYNLPFGIVEVFIIAPQSP